MLTYEKHTCSIVSSTHKVYRLHLVCQFIIELHDYDLKTLTQNNFHDIKKHIYMSDVSTEILHIRVL